MATIEDYAKHPIAERLARMRRTADELAEALRGQSDAVLSRRPDGKTWAAKEVELMAFVEGLTPAQRQRACIHPRRGRVTTDWFIAMLACHDDDHLDQLQRARDGRA